MAAAQLEVVLLRYVLDAQLPAEEPIMRWIALDEAGSADAPPACIRVGDHALLIDDCTYVIDRSTGVVEVRDDRDPRSMRSQRDDPARPGQPYLPPSVEERDPEQWP